MGVALVEVVLSDLADARSVPVAAVIAAVAVNAYGILGAGGGSTYKGARRAFVADWALDHALVFFPSPVRAPPGYSTRRPIHGSYTKYSGSSTTRSGSSRGAPPGTPAYAGYYSCRRSGRGGDLHGGDARGG